VATASVADAPVVCPFCGGAHVRPEPSLHKLWVYTNYDCNLHCSYCLVSSSPQAERRGFPYEQFTRLIDEAVALGCGELFLTGGEPAIYPPIFDMLRYATARLKTTLLTNGMLWSGPRLEKLEACRHPNLWLQISVDSATPDLHDYFRGEGSWARTIEGIKSLQRCGFRIKIGATQTLHSEKRMQDLEAFLATLGIPPQDQLVRPVAKRGVSKMGQVLRLEDLEPELTVDRDGVYWHPIGTDEDLLLSRQIFPLRQAVEQAEERMHALLRQGKRPRRFY
jgi:MoaA/NifB/PqqE/SkfB family radical SAM enzyme